MNSIIKLSELKMGEAARVKEILPECRLFRRFSDIGLTVDAETRCLFSAPSGGMRAYLIRGACIALRDEDACDVLVERRG